MAGACIAASLAAPEPTPNDAAEAKRQDDFVLRFQRAQRLLGGGHDAEAEKLLRQLISEEPKQAALHHALGVLLGFRKRPADAMDEFLIAATLAPEDAVIRRDAGLHLVALQRYAEAEPHLAAAVRLWPNDLESLVGHGAALRGLGRMHEAEGVYRRAVASDADSVDAAVGLAACLVARAPEEALRLIEKAPGPWPDVLLVRGSALLELGRLEDAAAQLATIVSVAPPDASGVAFLRGAAEALVLCGDAKNAGVTAKKWIEVESTVGRPSDAACLCLATALAAAGDHAGALAALDAAPPKRSPRTKLLRAVVLLRVAKKDDAKSALEELAASDKSPFESAAAARLLGKKSSEELEKAAKSPERANDVAWIESVAAEAAGDASAAAAARARAAESSRPRGEFPGLLVLPAAK